MAEPHRHSTRDEHPERLPGRVTMPLLTLITQQSMDEDYLHAAERRAARGGQAARGRPHRTAAVVVAVFGILVTTAAVQTSRNADVEDASRATLLTRISEERAEGARLQEQIVALRQDNAALEEESTGLGSLLQSAQTELRRLQVRTGFVPVRGPGIRLVVEDPEDGAAEVRKEDLYLLINGLWAAGAEAVALNGHRLSVLTSINNSDVAINVDYSALLPPYTLQAIGDPRRLGPDLLDTRTFAIFDAVRSRYGFGFDMENVDTVSLPAAREKRLGYAAPPVSDQDRRTKEDIAP